MKTLGEQLVQLAGTIGHDQMSVLDKQDGTYIVHYPKKRHKYLLDTMTELGFDVSKIEMRGRLKVKPL